MKTISLDRAKKEKLFYFVATAVVFRKSDGRALILKRSDREVAHPGRWGVIGGKMEWQNMQSKKPTRTNGNVLDWEHEIENLLVREAKEEASIDIDTSDMVYLNSVVYLREDGVPCVCAKFVVAYADGNTRIDSKDFDDFAWVNEKEIVNYECIDGICLEVKKAIALFNK